MLADVPNAALAKFNESLSAGKRRWFRTLADPGAVKLVNRSGFIEFTNRRGGFGSAVTDGPLLLFH